MRVLFISNNSSLGGAPKALLNLCREMAARGVEVGVVVPSENGPLVPGLRAIGAEVFSGMPFSLTVRQGILRPSKYIARERYLGKGLEEVRKYIGSVIDTFHPDIVHTNVGPLDLALDECRKRGIPHVWHLREYQTLDFGMKPYPDENSFRKKIRLEGNWNIAITQDVAKHWNLRAEDRVIYDGVFTEEQLSASGQPHPGGKFFLYAARIEKAKGLMTLLRAYRKYRSGGGQVPLMVCGRPCGLYATLCKAYASLFIGSSVSFEGVVNDVEARMKKALAVIVPSRCEAFGFTTAEAMRCGAILIGMDSAGTKEQLDRAKAISGGEAGLRFRSARDLADCLAIAGQGGIEEMSARAIAAAASYSTRRYADEVMNLYTEILS